jgi:hypothetical protein
MLPVRQDVTRSSLRTSPIPASSGNCEDVARAFCENVLGRLHCTRVCAEWLAFPDPSESKTHIISYLLRFSRLILDQPLSLGIRDDSLLLFEGKSHLSLSIHCSLSPKAQTCLQMLLQRRAFEVLQLRKPHRIFASRFKHNDILEDAFDRIDVLDCAYHAMLHSVRRRRYILCDVLDATLTMIELLSEKWPDLSRLRKTIEGFRN